MNEPSRQEVEEFLNYVNGWHGDVPRCMILTAPNESQDFFLWKRSRLTGEVMLRKVDMFEQIEKRI